MTNSSGRCPCPICFECCCGKTSDECTNREDGVCQCRSPKIISVATPIEVIRAGEQLMMKMKGGTQ